MESVTSLEEENVFELEDYTISGELEKFTSQIEDAIQEWELNSLTRYSPLDRNELSKVNWTKQVYEVSFPNFKFNLEYHHAQLEDDRQFALADDTLEEKRLLPVAMEDLACRNNDFMPRGHPLAVWYGLRSFMVLVSVDRSVIDDSLISTVSSAMNCALFNTGCETPVFLEVKKKYRQMFRGVVIGAGSTTDFDVLQLKRHSENCHREACNLSSLIHIFKSKIRSPLPNPVQLSIRLSYLVSFPFPYSKTTVRVGKYGSLPWGCMMSPVDFALLFTTWPLLSEDLVTDTPDYTDLDPLQAPQWSVRLVYNNNPRTSLAHVIKKFEKIWNLSRTLQYYTSELGISDNSGDVLTALDKISNSAAEQKLANVTGNITGYIPGGIGSSGDPKRDRLQEEVSAVMEVVFSDEAVISSDSGPANDFAAEMEQKLNRQMKSSPKGSVVRKLVLAIFQALANENDSELKVCLLWRQFCKQLRKYLTDSELVPTVSSKQPQLHFCLFQQKIEMLQYCIRCKIKREERLKRPSFENEPEVEQMETNSDEEFFDAEEMENEEIAEGREKSTGIKLLKFPTRDIFVPVMQQHPPLTEDMLIKQEEMMMSLGDDASGFNSRVQIQSQTLRSDMSAFKSANPGCVFEDFVRWHSPSDWSEESGLSPRMTLPGNHWVELWSNTIGEPVTRQKRLFDDTVEAERILTEFETANLADISKLICPVFIHEAICTSIYNFTEETEETTVSMTPVEEAVKHAAKGTFNVQAVSDLADQIATIETFEGRTEWLKRNFPESGDSSSIISSFNRSVLNSPETVIQGASRGPIAKIILEKIFDQIGPQTGPNSVPYSLNGLNVLNREYILRTKVCRPVRSSSLLPQRLYALIGQKEFRMAGAFSTDQTFFI